MNNQSSDRPQGREEVGNPGRRRFLSFLILVLGAVGTVILAVPVIGFVIGRMFHRPRGVWRKVGEVSKFKVGTTVSVTFENENRRTWDGITGRSAAWVRRESEGRFIAFSVNCTHLGCPVRWEPKANLFMCPCHGGVYYSDGDVAGGPPPKPLPRYNMRVRDGQVEIKTAPIPITVASRDCIAQEGNDDMRFVRRLWQWIEDRTGLGAIIRVLGNSPGTT